MQFDITVDAGQALAFFDRFGKQAPFAQATAINRTVEEAMAEGRKMITGALTVRAPRFVLPPVQLPSTARADHRRGRLQAAVQLGYDDGGTQSIGARRSLILSKFETGGTKVMHSTKYPVAVPTSVLRPNRSDLVQRKLYPRNLVGEFNQLGEMKSLGRKARLRGKKQPKAGTQVGRYFVLGGPSDSYWGIYRRFGPKDAQVEKLWTFKTSVPIPKRLGYYAMAQRLVAERFPINLMGAMEMALRTAK